MKKDISQINKANLILGLILTLSLLVSLPVGATEFFNDEEITKGLKGYGLTVIEGTEIERFDVEVIGVLTQSGPDDTLVLVRVSGDVIERSGGIASGMSGSPVYIDGKLLGAVSHGFVWGDHSLGLVTPISKMLKVLERIPVIETEDQTEEAEQIEASDEEDEKEAPFIRPDLMEISDGNFYRVILADTKYEAEIIAQKSDHDTLVAYPVGMPLMVNGMSKRGIDRLEKELQRFNIIPIQSGAAPGDTENPLPEPGAAVAVQLVRGDIEVSGLGTLTYIDNERFLAFGHEFFNLGNVNFFAAGGYIHTTVPNLEFPFKIGASLQPIGSITQDRGSAIGGVMGQLPEVIKFTVTVKNKDEKTIQRFKMDLVHQDQLFTSLAIVTALEAIDRGIDRIGDGTSRMILQINGEDWKKRLFRDNMFYSSTDIASASLVDLFICLQTILSNPFIQPNISEIKLEVDIEQKRNTATILGVRPNLTEVRPGNSVDVMVDILPYRGSVETKLMRMVVPKDTQPGELSVYVYGGGFGSGDMLSEYYENPEVESLESDEAPIYSDSGSFEELLDLLIDGEKNNEIVIEFYPRLDEEEDEDLYSYYLSEGVYSSLSTKYVIEGYHRFTINVLPAVDVEADSGNFKMTGAPEDTQTETEESVISEEEVKEE
jgi:hypothetical protein